MNSVGSKGSSSASLKESVPTSSAPVAVQLLQLLDDLAPHLLPQCGLDHVADLVHLNLHHQQILAVVPGIDQQLQPSPIPWARLLFWSNINPYGRFRLDMDNRLDLSCKGPCGATPEVSAVATGSYPRPKRGIPARTSWLRRGRWRIGTDAYEGGPNELDAEPDQIGRTCGATRRAIPTSTAVTLPPSFIQF